MVHAYDLWLQLPVKDLYDNLIMLASIQAAKDMYDKGLQEMKDFKKEYGDFFSPVLKDMDWYNENVTGKVIDTINYLYQSGIDPLRSPEGRAIISNVINGIDTGRMALNKATAENAKLFQRARGEMMANGTYDREFDEFANPDAILENWDSSKGVFPRTSPSKYVGLQELVHPSFSLITPHLLTEDQVKSRGFEYDPNYDWEGVVEDDMRQSLDKWMPGVRNNTAFRYHRELAKRDLLREGKQPWEITENDIDKKFIENAIASDAQMLTPLKREANPYALDEFRTKNDISTYRQKAQIDFDFDKKRARSGLGGGKGGYDNDNYGFNIFDNARVANGESVSFDNETDPYLQWIDPATTGVTKHDASGDENKPYGYFYNLPAKQVRLYRKDQKNPIAFGHDTRFVPNGEVRYDKKTNRYFMGGYIDHNKGDENARFHKHENGSRSLYWMEIKERMANYSTKQENMITPQDSKKKR